LLGHVLCCLLRRAGERTQTCEGTGPALARDAPRETMSSPARRSVLLAACAASALACATSGATRAPGDGGAVAAHPVVPVAAGPGGPAGALPPAVLAPPGDPPEAPAEVILPELAGAASEAAPADPMELLPELGITLEELRSRYDIPIDVNPEVVRYVRFFLTEPMRGRFLEWLGRSHRDVPAYRELLQRRGVPSDTVYLAMLESGFANQAYSRAHAAGPWQFIASTGKLYGLRQDFWVDERRDPEKSALAAAQFLRRMHDEFGDWRLAWAGYNAGPGRVRAAREIELGEADFWSMAREELLPGETRGYVPKLMALAILAKHPEAFGIGPREVVPQRRAAYEKVTVPRAAPLSLVARAAGVSEDDLQDLNPELRRFCTPPRPHQLKVPAGSAKRFAQRWPAASRGLRSAFAQHRVARGDTLAGLARRFEVPPEAILELNGLSSPQLQRGAQVLLPLPRASAVARTPPAPSRQGRRG
jgi:membrane-bound lytic murein transglycosylase D